MSDGEPVSDHLPLTDYGVVGDMQTLALVARTGSVDWMCWPRFDSPSVFGRLLDPGGGHWCIEPDEPSSATRHLYLPGTNVLLTMIDSMIADGNWSSSTARLSSSVVGTRMPLMSDAT